jgi:diaminohydroxyphosphoribosylaminopyrimidine deaminase/5-amino-6-(5-phosphoribosylamino)uracil reductase
MLDHDLMSIALAAGLTARTRTSPNPWVGAALLTLDGRVFEGATEPPGQRHAERVALDAAVAAGADLRGATLATTLEPCAHQGRTGPCVAPILEAGIRRVLVATHDPDPQVDGRGVTQLRAAGVEVTTGVLQSIAERDLQPYLHHRRTGRPFVVLKLATTIDGCVAAADGSSRWITGPEARRAVHELRAISDAVLVGAGTVRADDPELTTRLVDGPSPRRVVLGDAPAAAKAHPCTTWLGPIPELLALLGAEGVLQLLVEGGPTTAAAFHQLGLVDRYVFHLSPAIMGDGAGAFRGVHTPTIADLWRGRTVGVRTLGHDVEITVEPMREQQ